MEYMRSHVKGLSSQWWVLVVTVTVGLIIISKASVAESAKRFSNDLGLTNGIFSLNSFCILQNNNRNLSTIVSVMCVFIL